MAIIRSNKGVGVRPHSHRVSGYIAGICQDTLKKVLRRILRKSRRDYRGKLSLFWIYFFYGIRVDTGDVALKPILNVQAI